LFRVDDGTLLKYLYNCYYDQEKACETLKCHFEWMEKMKRKSVKEGALAYFVNDFTGFLIFIIFFKQNNLINLIGRDKSNKPVILFDLKKLEFKKVF